jgi:hypothetical protein
VSISRVCVNVERIHNESSDCLLLPKLGTVKLD